MYTSTAEYAMVTILICHVGCNLLSVLPYFSLREQAAFSDANMTSPI